MDLFSYAETMIKTEDKRLIELEATIENGLQTFVDVGAALLEIRDSKLYRKEYGTFEEYCQKRWGFTRMRASQLIAAAEVMENVNNCLQTPTNEAQARELAQLKPEEQRKVWAQVLEEAKDDKITAALIQRVAKEIDQDKRDERRTERIEKLAEISTGNKPLGDIGLFPVLYADPPWQYDHPISDSRRIENQYPTMPVQNICALPVSTISTPDAILFLWTSTPMLEKALIVMSAWEFEYRTSMVWIKPSIGPGQWVRQRHELLLIGVKGNIPTPRGEDKPDSVIEAPREEHSKKPEIVYDIIERMYPELPKVELFCRDPRDGWTSWGNET